MAEQGKSKLKFTAELRTLLERYIPRERIDRIEAGDANAHLSAPRTIGLLLCQVRDDDVDTIAHLSATATDLLTGAGAIVETSRSSLIVATFGAVDFGAETALLEPTVGRLRDRMKGDVRLVYGRTMARIGNIGGASQLSFGSVIPRFGDWLVALTALAYGEAKELRLQHPSGQPGL